MDRPLPLGSLDFFPVQYFSQRELPQARTPQMRTSRGSSGVRFGDSFNQGRRSMGGSTPHRAIDIIAPRGVPVFAAVGGIVPATWSVFQEISPGRRRRVAIPAIGTPTNPPNNDGGNYVVMVDRNGKHHYYAHLDSPALVRIGQRVEAGTLLGYVGSTGRGSMPHLHYQITTRPDPQRGIRTLTFWNAYQELSRLATMLGGQPRRYSTRVDISYDAFLREVQDRQGNEIVDPWTGEVIPTLRNPWDVAF